MRRLMLRAISACILFTYMLSNCLTYAVPSNVALNGATFGAGFNSAGIQLENNKEMPLMNAADGDLTTYFATDIEAVSGYFGVYLFNKHPVNTIKIYEPSETVTSYRLQWSNTGTEWTDMISSTQPIGTTGRSFSFPRVDGRFFRIKVEAVQMNEEGMKGFQIAEFETSFDTTKNLIEANRTLVQADNLLANNGLDEFVYSTSLIEQLQTHKEELTSAMNNPLLVQYQLENYIKTVQNNIAQLYETAQVPDAAFEQVRHNMESILLEDKATYSAASANTLESTMIKNNGSALWSDIGSAEAAMAALASDTITNNYKNIRTMAYAYAVPASSRYQDAALLANIKYALSIARQYWYNENTVEYGNWWPFDIGVPLQFTEILILLWDDLTDTEKANYSSDLEAFVDPDYVTNSTGANRIHIAICDSRMGVLNKNLTKVKRAQQAFEIEINFKDGNTVVTRDGFYTDGSFIQHSYIAYNGSYGSTMMDYLVTYIREVSGSPWSLKEDQIEKIYLWYKDGFMPLMYSGSMMDMVNGRAIVRKNNDKALGYTVLDSIVRFANTLESGDKKTDLLSFVKRMLNDDTFYNWQTKTGSDVKAVMNDASIPMAGKYIGNHSYHNMDRVVHHQNGYAFGLSMFSSRIRAFEQTNGENLKGWYTGSGMTYLYNKDDSQYTDDYWWTVDMYRLPGTTLTTAVRSTERWQGEFLSKYDFVGSASYQDTYGVAAMETEQWKSDLTVRKSWFMFDDEVVCLGSNITASTDTNPVLTVVENRRLEKSSGANEFRINNVVQPASLGWNATLSGVKTAFLKGTAASGADVGYYFPTPVTLSAKREHVEKLPSDVSSGNTQTTYAKNNFLSFSISHGIKPTNAQYSYVIFPNKTTAALESYAQNPNIEILTQTSSLHAVREKTLGITGIASFENKIVTVGDVTLDKAALVMIKDDGSFVISDPSRKQGKVTVTINQDLNLYSDNARAEIRKQNGQTIVTVNLTGLFGEGVEISR